MLPGRGVLYYHDRLVISAAVTADRAKFLIRQRIALRAVSDILPRLDHRGCQPFYVIQGHVYQVKSQPCR